MVQAEDIVQNPLGFLSLVNKHQEGMAFVPMFFVAALSRGLEKTEEKKDVLRSAIDVQCLRTVVLGGEANQEFRLDRVKLANWANLASSPEFCCRLRTAWNDEKC